ncbi:MBL fold metallo-hydrolase [Marinobacterium sp. YM272]|uniref:MBL fold metallo-hydrolase n=1 Tax=Marinobacterium sp. YM272 TaxID=3421654 RepID=UPI003D7FECA6
MITSKRLTSLEGNSQMLDGGAMFGNAPKAMWQRWCEPDDLNRIRLGCRALLVQEYAGVQRMRNILIEAGVGAFFSPEMKQRFGVQESHHRLLESLADQGLGHEDIDVVVLTHLHFDHAGGLLSAWQNGQDPRLLFPNATFVVGETQWHRANDPHARDRASYIPTLNQALAESGRLELVPEGEQSPTLGADYSFHLSSGHTPGQILPEIDMPEGPLLFAGDLIPGAPWVHLPITMGYDRFPEQLIDEKRSVLAQLGKRNGRLVFTHDPDVALGRIDQDERGRYRVVDTQASFAELAA